MIRAAKNEPAVEYVLEIGPGHGVLTRALAEKFKHVIAIEKDAWLAGELAKKLNTEKITNCKIIAGDILKINFQKLLGKAPYAVIANIPYYLTGRLIRLLLETKHRPSYIILMVQKEVAERITAGPPEMNMLALSVQAFGKPRIMEHVSKKEFSPPPQVDSAIIKISGISEKFFVKNKISEKEFFAIIRATFSQKRKRLANTLAKFYGDKKIAEEKIKKTGLSKNARPQELTLKKWLKLSDK